MDDFNFTSMIAIEKGWSGDKKYFVTNNNGDRFLFRTSPIERFEDRKELYSILKKVEKLKVNMCKAIEFGRCDEGVYTLYSWIDGEDAEDIIHYLSDEEQYSLGFQSGIMLKEIHKISSPNNQEDWYSRFNKKINIKIQKYKECPLSFEGDFKVIEYIESHRELLRGRPQCFQHGDYHIGNMMYRNKKLIVIDFDRYDFGDPWEEFNRIVWCAQKSPYFATGQINGYFAGKPPIEFFELLTLYIACNTLSSIYWAIPFGQSEINTMMNQAKEVLQWFDGMEKIIPSWYKNDIS